MEAAFSSIAFGDPARAETNLALIEKQLPGGLWASLPTLLAQVPDPDGALNYLERYLRPEVCGPAQVVPFLGRNPAALHYLLVIFSFSRFLSETLMQQPELITWLHRPSAVRTLGSSLERIKSPEDLHEEFARFEATLFDQPPAVVLARFKRREYLRITLRDVLGLATLAETTLELSHLADVLLERALRACEQKLLNAYGMPQFTDAEGRKQLVRLTILSLGKLGGQELNYNSDIDLMFLYGQDGETAGGTAGAISNGEFFVRLAQAILKLITEATPEGALFRVDLRLRPQGSEGDLALPLATALNYYRTAAREWELQMLIKARCSAGDAESARLFLHALRPLIYRPEFNLSAVEAVLNARQEMTRELRRRAGKAPEKWNVKLSPGGIRDIEFLAQSLQRLYGGSDAWLAAPAAASTLLALQRLHDKRYLTGRDFFRLATAYQFLRKVEHRLQLRDGLQRHTLPSAPDALDRLARRCGLEPAPSGTRSPGEQLVSRVTQHFAEVRQIYERILLPQVREDKAVAPAEGPEHPEASAVPLFQRLGREAPTLARAVAEASAASDAYGRHGLHRYLSSAVLDPEAMKQLIAHPEFIARAAEVFSRSELAVDMLTRHPGELNVLADPGLGGFRGPLVAAGLEALPFEEALAALRIAYRRGLLAIVIRALLGSTRPFETFEALTRLAEEALRSALHLSAQEVLPKAGVCAEDARDLESAPFAVIALGRLGTFEMDVASDADLVFVREAELSAEAAEPWRRFAERFVHVVGSHSREGLLFPVDTRLRPRGTEGEMVQSLAYLRDYFRSEARAWEGATYLKARPVAGNFALGARAVAEIHAILAERWRATSEPDAARRRSELAREFLRTRERLEKEGTARGHDLAAKGEFKKRRGGYYDIEYVLAFLFLTRDIPQAESRGHVLRQIAALESAGALDTAAAQSLRSAALLYRSVDHALRLITGHPANRLPEPAIAGRVVRMLELWGLSLPRGLDEALKSAAQEVRALYDCIVGGAAAPE